MQHCLCEHLATLAFMDTTHEFSVRALELSYSTLLQRLSYMFHASGTTIACAEVFKLLPAPLGVDILDTFAHAIVVCPASKAFTYSTLAPFCTLLSEARNFSDRLWELFPSNKRISFTYKCPGKCHDSMHSTFNLPQILTRAILAAAREDWSEVRWILMAKDGAGHPLEVSYLCRNNPCVGCWRYGHALPEKNLSHKARTSGTILAPSIILYLKLSTLRFLYTVSQIGRAEYLVIGAFAESGLIRALITLGG